jgi:hypothetical protein
MFHLIVCWTRPSKNLAGKTGSITGIFTGIFTGSITGSNFAPVTVRL